MLVRVFLAYVQADRGLSRKSRSTPLSLRYSYSTGWEPLQPGSQSAISRILASPVQGRFLSSVPTCTGSVARSVWRHSSAERNGLRLRSALLMSGLAYRSGGARPRNGPASSTRATGCRCWPSPATRLAGTRTARSLHPRAPDVHARD